MTQPDVEPKIYLNVFYCEVDQLACAKKDDELVCWECNEPMKSIGWFESVS